MKQTVPPTEEEPVRARFCLPGTEGFDDVFSWKKNPRRVSDENDRRSSSASSRKSEESDVNEEDNCNSNEEESSDDEGLLSSKPRSNKRPKLGGLEDEDSDEY